VPSSRWRAASTSRSSPRHRVLAAARNPAQHGLPLAQGFLFAKPCSCRRCAAFLRVEPLDLLDNNWQTNSLAETG
jgi:hypothetical protein